MRARDTLCEVKCASSCPVQARLCGPKPPMTYLQGAGFFVLSRFHRESNARAGNTRHGLRERGDRVFEAEPRRLGRRERKRRESVDERHRVRRSK